MDAKLETMKALNTPSAYQIAIILNKCRIVKTAYGLINLEYCEETFSLKTTEASNCLQECEPDSRTICGIREEDAGFRIKLFKNKCDMIQHNCRRKVNFSATDDYVCNNDEARTEVVESKKTNNTLIIVDASLFYDGNINHTIDNFFAATHVVNMPLQELDKSVVNETTRRRLVANAGPVVIYQPWVKIPKNVSEDIYHRPTLASCYHKCPTKCPNTYAPVCGVPGMKAREPSLMFQNHCYMDVAQCKMNYEDIGPTAVSSAYIESPFIFCMGEQLSRMYVLLPLVRTLQHMGRLRRKGRFRYRLRDMRHDNIAANKVMG
ncbi:hypothetical protein MSG28_010424 [Choristoneura fumiferana]|uniref:Uncharacterized protein n=1 Tax=Choristoneura fumiferana TaxID=7141 RepID=A0ACC0KLB5_CHOFU|nr:hypothetical protein MSG28_010424 [Choristoneura fumiferana]